VDLRILAPVLPSISESLRASPGVVGLAMTSYAITYGTGQLFYGPLSDRRSRIAVVRAAGLGFSLCTVLAALAFSASIGGTVAYFVSWRVMLLGYGILALVPVGCMWRLDAPRPSGLPGGTTSPGRYGEFLLDRRAQRVCLAVFFEGFLLWGSVTYLGSFATDRYGFDQFVVGLLIALFGLGTMVGGLLMPLIRRRISENMLAGIGGTLMGVAFLLLVPRVPWQAFATSMVILGLGFVLLHSTLQLRGTEISQTARGKAFSLFPFNLFIGIAAGTAVLGRLVDAGRYGLLFASTGFGLILIGLGTALPSRRIRA
jgi:predicted MFS family arabinose efflux permease